VGRGEFPISRATDDQFLPVVAFTPPAQQYAVFWADGRTGQFTHIFGQRLSRTGLPAGYGFGAVGAPGAQEDPAVAYNSVEEDYLAVWADERGADPDIYGQRYTAEGRLLGDNFIIYQATGEQIRPAVAFNSLDDSYLVVWEDVAAGAIMGRIMGPQGNPLAAPFTVSTGTAPRHWPRVAYNSNPAHDNYLVVFECDNPFDPPDESGVDFCRRLVSAAGVPEAGEPRAYRDGDDLRPAAVYNPDDNQYLVVRTVGHYATAMVWAERIDAHGDWMPGTGVEVTSPGVKTWAPGVAYNSADNEYLVFWTEYTSAGDVLRARIMGADESLPGLVFMISSGSTLADDSVGAGLYFPAANRYRVVWDDPRTPESAWDIWGQWVEADGATSAETELPVFRTTGWQRNPDIAFGLQDGDAFTVWQDGRNGVASDVYGRLGALDHTPPVAAFTASPAVGVAGAPFTFDASPSRDNLTPPGALEVRWDFQNDGVWDTEFAAQKMITHTYALQGARTVALQARDWAALTGVVTHTIGVLPQAAGAAAAPAANPPVARLTVTPDHAEAGAIFTADASASTGVGTLRVRWDWENDGNFDTGFSTNLIATHAYTVSDDYVIRAELLDGTGLTAAALRIVTVLPGDPVSLLVRPAAVRLIPGQTVRFRAAAWDLYGNRLWNPEVEWSLAAPAAGKLDDAGWFTAGLRAGLYPDAVAATLGPLTARAAVRVFWPQRLHLPLVRR
jgi:PKD repeat protein